MRTLILLAAVVTASTSFTSFASGAIRGRVDVRAAGGIREMRPDPGGLGMPAAPDPRDRRRSVVYLESAPRGAFDPGEERRARMDQRNERFMPHVLAVTDDDGRYRLEGVPPGTYTLAVWNETIHGDPPRRTVTIGESGGDVEADFTIR